MDAPASKISLQAIVLEFPRVCLCISYYRGPACDNSVRDVHEWDEYARDFKDGQTPLVRRTKGRDKDLPKLSLVVPYNPFLLDVHILGNVYRKVFVEKYSGLEILQPLSSSILQEESGSRSTVDAAHLQFNENSHWTQPFVTSMAAAVTQRKPSTGGNVRYRGCCKAYTISNSLLHDT
ncbi:hypothetical protein K474DRAFT_1235242 [Panus rudis PR-1116 ss-1]|nr:hypothetical protein K474DRAFT_1235242 [Panus rudis PR-1116 ss-1]